MSAIDDKARELGALMDAADLRQQLAARTYYLGNLRTVDDMAEQFGVSRRRAQAIAKEHHERWGRGMKVGGTYIFSEDEIESMRPAAHSGRPPQSRT